jgi:DNA-binding PadR family transcriptional regulator
LSARYAVLGMLREGPAYSYELAARIHDLLGPGFDINTGQMSALTSSLRKDELIELVAHRGQPRRRRGSDRRIYALTEKGAAEFEQFFEKGPNEAKLFRRSLLVKIALAGPERLADVLEQIDAYEQHCTDRIDELTGELNSVVPDEHLHPSADRVVLRLGIEADISQLRAELGWARHAREMVSWLLHSDAIWPSTSAARKAMSDPAQVERADARKQLLTRLAVRNWEERC